MLSAKKILFYSSLLMTLIFSGCNGCNDGILGSTCTYESQQNTPCFGSGEEFEYLNSFSEEDRANYEVGTCTIGKVACLTQVITQEQYCELNGGDCEKEYERKKYNDICIGNIRPAVEECGDGLDNNCDGEIDEGYDFDNDGFQTAAKVNSKGEPCGTDCNDFNNAAYPGAPELCDGFDNNCNCDGLDTNNDGIICGCSMRSGCVSPDDGDGDPTTWDYLNRCCDKNVDEDVTTGYPMTLGDSCWPDNPTGIDVDNLVYEDTQCVYEEGKTFCDNGKIKCDAPPLVGPESEVCDGLDNDCNGVADDYTEGSYEECGSDVGACVSGLTVCNSEEGDLVCAGGYDGSPDDNCDGLDNDCDGDIDEHFAPQVCHNGCPEWGFEYCVQGRLTNCDAPMPTSEEETPCDGEDNDCDGLIDEGLVCECDPEIEVGPYAPSCTIAEMLADGIVCGKAQKDCIPDPDGPGFIYGPCELRCDPWVGGQPNDDLSTWWGACSPEQCDGWDHNCEGGAVDGVALMNVPCMCDEFHPNPNIAGHFVSGGDCNEGLCTSGSQTCECVTDCENPNVDLQTWKMMPEDCNAVGPTEELACTGEDEDCDGEVDEGDYFDRVDLVFIIDVTGSMTPHYNRLLQAINAYAADFNEALCDDGNGGQEQCHKFSLILFPEPGGSRWQSDWGSASQCGSSATWNYGMSNYGGPHFNATRALYSNSLVDFDEFLYTLGQVLPTGLVCGSEPSYDVLKSVSDPSDPLGIGWRPNAYPYVFFIGDEAAQTWEGVTEQQVAPQTEECDGIGMCPCLPPTCSTPVNEFELHCFIGRPYYNYYDSICYNVVQSPADNIYDIEAMNADILRGIFSDVCLQQEEEE